MPTPAQGQPGRVPSWPQLKEFVAVISLGDRLAAWHHWHLIVLCYPMRLQALRQQLLGPAGRQQVAQLHRQHSDQHCTADGRPGWDQHSGLHLVRPVEGHWTLQGGAHHVPTRTQRQAVLRDVAVHALTMLVVCEGGCQWLVRPLSQWWKMEATSAPAQIEGTSCDKLQ